eukprot:jgi/Botrbrau1/22817/Bobra.0132s0140.1
MPQTHEEYPSNGEEPRSPTVFHRLLWHLKKAYFQYEICFAANCFAPWEKVIVACILLSSTFLVIWGLWRFGVLQIISIFRTATLKLENLHERPIWVSPSQDRLVILKNSFMHGLPSTEILQSVVKPGITTADIRVCPVYVTLCGILHR